MTFYTYRIQHGQRSYHRVPNGKLYWIVRLTFGDPRPATEPTVVNLAGYRTREEAEHALAQLAG